MADYAHGLWHCGSDPCSGCCYTMCVRGSGFRCTVFVVLITAGICFSGFRYWVFVSVITAVVYANGFRYWVFVAVITAVVYANGFRY